MSKASRTVGGTILVLALATACDSASPASERLLRVQGEILEAGEPPEPPLVVAVQAWPPADPGGIDVAAVRTDVSGSYAAELGPFPTSVVDSLRLRVTQNDCDLQAPTDLWRHDLSLADGETLVLPSLTLSYRLAPAQFSIGAAMCAAIVRTEDYARLALWIDDVSDSVRGRWRLNHSASIGDDYGYFSGFLQLDRLMLQLRPTQPTPCPGLQLGIPVGGDNGSTLGASELAGNANCFVPSGPVRFFDGASLSEVLPPIAD